MHAQLNKGELETFGDKNKQLWITEDKLLALELTDTTYVKGHLLNDPKPGTGHLNRNLT